MPSKGVLKRRQEIFKAVCAIMQSNQFGTHGGARRPPNQNVVRIKDLSEYLGCSDGIIKKVKTILEEGSATTINSVASGEKSFDAAHKELKNSSGR